MDDFQRLHVTLGAGSATASRDQLHAEAVEALRTSRGAFLVILDDDERRGITTIGGAWTTNGDVGDDAEVTPGHAKSAAARFFTLSIASLQEILAEVVGG